MSNSGEPRNTVPSQEGEENSLGMAGGIAKAFIRSPLSPLLFFAALFVGVFGMILTPRQEDPEISVPMVDIFFHYPGVAADDVARLAVDPLQRMMSEIQGVKHVYSMAMRGQGAVTVRFMVGEDPGPSMVKVRDKLNANMDKMPPGVGPPLTQLKTIDSVPVVTVTLWAQPRKDFYGSKDTTDMQLRLLAQDVMQQLNQVENTAESFVVGGRKEEVRVEVIPDRLSGYNISLDLVAQTIRSANAEQTAGRSETGGTSFSVTTGAFLKSADDIKRLVLAVRNGVPVYVRDVARVSEEPEDTKEIVNQYSGPGHEEHSDNPMVQGSGPGHWQPAPAITIGVAKKQGSNGVTVANQVLEKLDALRGTLIPDNVNVLVTRNYGQTADEKVNELVFKLFYVTIMVTILAWIALGVRPAIVVFLIVPVVVLTTIFGAYMMDYSINRVSLFALIFAIGILVDDAIVVVENIYRRWLEKGETDDDTAVDAVREVGNPTIIATMTVVAALLPMGFVTGMMGPYMAPIPALGSVAMILSLFAAFVFTPWLTRLMKPSMKVLHKAEQKEQRQKEVIGKYYRHLMVPIIENRFLGWMTLFGIVAVFFLACSMIYFEMVSVKMLPFDNKSEFDIVIDMPEGTALPDTANVVQRIAAKVLDADQNYVLHSEADCGENKHVVTNAQSYVGTASPFNFNGLVRHYYVREEPWQADIQIQLTDKKERDCASHHIADVVRNVIADLAAHSGVKTLTVAEVPPGPPVLQALEAEIYGPDAATRRKVATDLTEIFKEAEVPGDFKVVDVGNYMQTPHMRQRFVVETDKAIRRGITVDTINRNLSMAMGSTPLGDIKTGRRLEPTYIMLQVPLAVRSQLARLTDLPIPKSGGGTVPLAELGHFVTVPEDPVNYFIDLSPVEYVVGDVTGRLGAPIYGMFEIEKLMKEKLPYEVETHWTGPPDTSAVPGFEWAGEWTVTFETFRDMGIAFAVALVLIYILVVGEFKNFLLPAVIMAPIPLTLVGIVPGHWMFSAEFTATSMIGFIALAGIIVRNSILLVDFARHQVLKGMDIQEAVLVAGETRMRPIVITAMALVLDAAIILSDPIFQGMAVSLLFGVIVSTFLTLIVIPLGCISARNSFVMPAGSPAGSAAVQVGPQGMPAGAAGAGVPAYAADSAAASDAGAGAQPAPHGYSEPQPTPAPASFSPADSAQPRKRMGLKQLTETAPTAESPAAASVSEPTPAREGPPAAADEALPAPGATGAVARPKTQAQPRDTEAASAPPSIPPSGITATPTEPEKETEERVLGAAPTPASARPIRPAAKRSAEAEDAALLRAEEAPRPAESSLPSPESAATKPPATAEGEVAAASVPRPKSPPKPRQPGEMEAVPEESSTPVPVEQGQEKAAEESVAAAANKGNGKSTPKVRATARPKAKTKTANGTTKRASASAKKAGSRTATAAKRSASGKTKPEGRALSAADQGGNGSGRAAKKGVAPKGLAREKASSRRRGIRLKPAPRQGE